MTLNNPQSGGAFVPEFLVAPAPWVTQSSIPSGGVISYQFSYLARSVRFLNHDSGSVNIGYSLNGVNATNRFLVPTSGTFEFDCRFTSFFVKGVIGQQFSLMVGLTGVEKRHVLNVTASNGYTVG